MVRNGEITRANDVHAYEHVRAGDLIALCDGNARKTDAIRQRDIYQVGASSLFAAGSMRLNLACRCQTQPLACFFIDAGIGRTGVPNGNQRMQFRRGNSCGVVRIERLCDRTLTLENVYTSPACECEAR